MGATSVTGKGLGSADGKNKGSAHMTLGAEKLVGPRVVACDEITLDGSGDLVVNLPALSGVSADYICHATDSHATAATACACALAITNTATTLTFKGTAAQTVAYSIIKKGLAV
jgi:hypothetical protein